MTKKYPMETGHDQISTDTGYVRFEFPMVMSVEDAAYVEAQILLAVKGIKRRAAQDERESSDD